MTDVRHDLALQTLSLPISSRFVAFNPNKNENKKKLLRTKPEEEEEALFLVATFH